MFFQSLTSIGPFAMNCYLLGDLEQGEAVVIDPGGEVPRILRMLEQQQLTLSKILNTHGHIDHVVGVQELKEKTGAPFYLHRGDEFLLQDLAQKAPLYGFGSVKTPVVDHYLEDGEEITVGRLRLEVIHTPGHSPGGVCFHLAAQRILFSGDTLFAGSVGRVDLEGGSAETLLQAIHQKLAPLDPNTRVYPGHGPETTIGREVQFNPFLQPGALRYFGL
ncbi:MAG: MBL fold metallo-hydrolase [Nitrospinota bacterium]|nr:MAG: MBL fold metallo-hydrolase [Nitrospinota bacterium]